MDNQNTKLTVYLTPSQDPQVCVSRAQLLEMSLYCALAEAYLSMRILEGREAEFLEDLQIANSHIQMCQYMSSLEFLGQKDLSSSKKLQQLQSKLKIKATKENIARCFQFPIYYELYRQRYKVPSEYQILCAAATFLNVKLRVQRKQFQTEIQPNASFSKESASYEVIQLFRMKGKFNAEQEEQESKSARGAQNVQLAVDQALYKQFLKWGNTSEKSEWGSMIDRYQSTLATPRKQYLDLRATDGWDESTINQTARKFGKNEESKSKISMSLIDLCFDLHENVEEESRDRILNYLKQYAKIDSKASELAKIHQQYITLDTCRDTVPLEGTLKLFAQKFELAEAQNLFMVHQNEVESPRCPQCGKVLNPDDLVTLLPHLDANSIRRLFSVYYSHKRQDTAELNPLYLQKVVDCLISKAKALNSGEWETKFQQIEKKMQKVYDLFLKARSALQEKIKSKKEAAPLRKQLEKLTTLAKSTKFHNEKADISILREACIEGLRLLMMIAGEV